ncbi:MAG: adenylyltransferase/cytidyltransferase family protein [Candidatus Thermoplasmatota archaeon]
MSSQLWAFERHRHPHEATAQPKLGGPMKRILAVGVFDLLHAGHLHYLEQAKSLGDHLTVVVAHDDTVRKRKHEPVTNQDLRRRMVAGLKPVDVVVVGNPPDVPIFDILPEVQPDVIALGYDQEHAEENIRHALQERGHGAIEVVRVEGLSDDLDGTRKIIARILERAEKKGA